MSPVALRLSVMMFLQFFIWGAWYVTAPRYLGTIGFAGGDFGWMYSVGPIAGILAPFFVGMIADRYFASDRMLAVLHLLGGGILLGSTVLMQADVPSPAMINLAFFGHMLCFYPTLALTNSVSMANLDDTEKQFPLVRVFGTLGWIVAGFTLGRTQWGGTIDQFYLAGGAAVLLGLYSLSLPHTPPPNKGKEVSARELLGLDAFVMLKQPAFLVFMVCSFLICIPLAFYYQLAERSVVQGGLNSVPFAGLTLSGPDFMSFGQASEVLFMVLMPFFFARLGVKWMLAFGMLAWVARYGLFAIGAPDDIAWMMVMGIVLHGICYDFFFVTGQIYTDKSAPAAIRSQAQGMLVLFTLGLGMLIGAQIGGRVEARYTPPETGRLNAEAAAAGEYVKTLQKEFDALPEAARTKAGEVELDLTAANDGLDAKVATAAKDESAKVLVADEALEQAGADGADADRIKELTTARDDLLKAKYAVIDTAAAEAVASAVTGAKLDGDAGSALDLRARMDAIKAYGGRRGLDALNEIDWRSIWTIPAIASAIVLVLFVATFHDSGATDESETQTDLADVDSAASGEGDPGGSTDESTA